MTINGDGTGATVKAFVQSTQVTVTVTADLDLDGSPETVLGEAPVDGGGNWSLSEYEYNLPVGTVALHASQQIVIDEIAVGNNVDNANLTNTSFAGAQSVASDALVSGVPIMLGGIISPRATVGIPGGSALEFPTQPGSLEEPGQRDVPAGSGGHGIPEQEDAPHRGIQEVRYNFRSRYSQNPDLPDLVNAITEEQKARTREIFEIYSLYTGVRFIETEYEGITVVTGDLRGLSPTTDPGPGILGIAWVGQRVGSETTGFEMRPGSLSVMNSLSDWVGSEFGGGWFDTAIHEIGHNLGLQHSYDLPSNEGRFSPSDLGEEALTGIYDIGHLLQLYPKLGSDIDLYRFTIDKPGTVNAETIVARPGQEALSQLDTVLTVYRETELNGVTTRSMVARNDNSVSRDSLLSLDLEAGDYYVAVTSAGNTNFDPEVEESGYGGRSEGAYRLHLEFTEKTSPDSSIKDVAGTPLDGDQDGVGGGKYKFWFKTASPDNIKFVDKSATDANATVINVDNVNSNIITVNSAEGIQNGMLVFGSNIAEGTTVDTVNTETRQIELSPNAGVINGESLRFVHPGDGTITHPFLKISDAVSEMGTGQGIIRVLGKAEIQLVNGRPVLNSPNVEFEDDEYYIGLDKQGNPLPDGENLDVPAGVTLMIDEGAVFNMRKSNIDVGSSSQLDSRERAAIQVLGTPSKRVVFTGFNDSEFKQTAVVYDLDGPTEEATVTGVVTKSLISTVDTTGNAVSATLSPDGNTAYVADDSAGLKIVNVNIPETAVVIGVVTTVGDAVSVTLSSDGDTAYVAVSDGGLQIIDVRAPSTAAVIGTVDTAGTAVGVALSSDGNTAYVADSAGGLQIIDVTDPATVAVIGTVDTTGTAVGVTLSSDGNAAYVADSAGGLQIIDVTDPVTAAVIGTVDTTGTAVGVTLSSDGNTAYVADSAAGLQIIDVTDPSTAAVIGTVDTTGLALGVTLSADDGRAYVADHLAGLQLIDVTDPVTASVLGIWDTADIANGVILSSDGTKAYVSDQTAGLQIIEVDPVDFSAIYSLDSAFGIQDGMLVFGEGIVPGTTVSVTADQRAMTLSQPATNLSENTVLTFIRLESVVNTTSTVTETATSNVVSVANSSGITSGMVVYGDGIPSGTTVFSVDSDTNTVTLQEPSGQLIVEVLLDTELLFVDLDNMKLDKTSNFSTDGLARSGQWGGIVLREDSDTGLPNAFLNSVNHAVISWAGGKVVVDSQENAFSPFHIEASRPLLGHSQVTSSQGAAVSVTPNSFLDDDGRSGPAFHGNYIRENSLNGVLIDVNTEVNGDFDKLTVAARLSSTEVTYVLQENLLITGGAGGYLQDADSKFDINVEFAGLDNGTVAEENVMEAAYRAKAVWENIIVGDLSNQVVAGGRVIDDIEITVQAGFVDVGLFTPNESDGPGGALANANPGLRRLWSDVNPFLPYTGSVGVDMVDTGNLDALTVTLVREFGHALGFVERVLEDFQFINPDGEFTGPHAVTANGGVDVPLDQNGNNWAEVNQKEVDNYNRR